MEPAIHIQELGKRYTRRNSGADYATLRDTLTNFRSSRAGEHFWALRDINLSVAPGERIGIIGRNGAGKSTLLKIISRITPPTVGRVVLNGRVASLLEVGTGFHPELNGRENIFLNGSILGLKRAEINRRLDEIIAFSGVGEFIDMPLKNFSSGMGMRLAFSVAAHLHGEILLIDEVLAVGDVEFQRKCIGKMQEISQREGRTIVFVSHDLNAISLLTDQCLVLEKGGIETLQPSRDAIQHYLSITSKQSLSFHREKTGAPSILSVAVATSEKNGMHLQGQPLSVRIRIDNPKREAGLAVAFIIRDEANRGIVHISLFDHELPLSSLQEEDVLHCVMPSSRLYMGRYTLHVFLAQSRGSTLYDEIQNICPFEVSMIGKPHGYKWIEGVCTYIEDFKWEVTQDEV